MYCGAVSPKYTRTMSRSATLLMPAIAELTRVLYPAGWASRPRWIRQTRGLTAGVRFSADTEGGP